MRGGGESALLLLWALAGFADKHGEAFPSRRELMAAAGIVDKRTFRRALDAIVERIGLEVIPRGKKRPSGQWCTLYRLKHDKEAAPARPPQPTKQEPTGARPSQDPITPDLPESERLENMRRFAELGRKITRGRTSAAPQEAAS